MDTSCYASGARPSSSFRRITTNNSSSSRNELDGGSTDVDADAPRDTTALHGNARDTWAFRSTIGADSDDDDDLESDNQQNWSDDERSDNNNASLSATDDDEDHDESNSRNRRKSARYHMQQQQQERREQQQQVSRQRGASNQDDEDEHLSAQSPPTTTAETKKPPKLLSIPGFSNSEALKTRLPVRRAVRSSLTSTPYILTTAAAVGGGSGKSDKGLPHKLALKQQQQQTQKTRTKGKLDPLALRSDRLALKKRQQQHLGPVPERCTVDGDDVAARGKSLEHKIAMHEELTRLDDKTNRKCEDHDSSLFPQLEAPAPQRAAVTYRMTAPMVYVIACTSAATLHCALFNFSLELRRLWRVDALPFGVYLLVCWALVGLLSFTGGWLGDLVHDRVTLMRRAALLWVLATLLIHVAAFRAGSTLSAVVLALALPAACIAHGVLAPNCVVLGAYTFSSANDRCCRQRRPSEADRDDSVLASTPHDDSDQDDDAVVRKKKLAHEHVGIVVGDEYSRRSSGIDDRAQQLLAAHKMAIHRYFSRCLGASLAGSSSVQLFFFLLVDVDSLSLPTPSMSTSPALFAAAGVRDISTRQSLVGRQGYLCMLLASALLLAALICFLFHSHSHFQPPLPPRRAADALERKIALHEQARDAFSWRAVVRVFSRTLIGYALLLAVLVALIGVGMAVVSMLVVRETSFNVRLASFLMICVGWYAAMSIGRYQLRSTSTLSTTCERLGVPLVQLQSTLLLMFFVCMSSLSAFLRAQLYTTLVVQVCQTRLELPGVSALFNPNALGAVASVVSLVLIPISNATVPRPRKTGATTTSSSPRRRLCITAVSPSRRLSIGICLYLVGIFLSSVVELYRRKRVSIAEPQPKCTKAYSDFGVLWTAPHVVLLGLSDTVFRVSLHEQLHSIRLLTSRWPGFMQGIVEFSEMVGYVGALALTSMLSTWLFRPHTSDLAVVLLLMTTLLAFAYASLKRVAEKIAAGHIGDGGECG